MSFHTGFCLPVISLNSRSTTALESDTFFDTSILIPTLAFLCTAVFLASVNSLLMSGLLIFFASTPFAILSLSVFLAALFLETALACSFALASRSLALRTFRAASFRASLFSVSFASSSDTEGPTLFLGSLASAITLGSPVMNSLIFAWVGALPRISWRCFSSLVVS